MSRRIPLVLAATGGGMLAAALVSTAVATADDTALTVDFEAAESDIDYAIELPGLLELGTGTGAFTLNDGDGTDIGEFTDDSTTVFNILGVHTMQFTFDSDSFSVVGDGADPGDVPVDGTSYSVTDFGFGIQNIYETVPAGADGGGAEITDTLVTPLGDFGLPTSLSELFTEGVEFEGGGLFSGIFGDGSQDELSAETTIAAILEHNDVESSDFDGGDLGDVGNALATDDDVFVAGGNVTADEVTEALESQGITFENPADFGAQDLAALLNGEQLVHGGLEEFFITVFGGGAVFDKIAEADGLLGDLGALIASLF